ncbi:hypothetical protein FGADI_12071 [Fusarium gaditjirri]|uniref:2EXR domain-containing protein n=1 Tax=Fusarium gaditjirri TaxID=282569 RepID=A0A8H4STB0_9HYPO|nr:hypothetical protein FGADI_12071 [Fusarium gaditjirri]
MGFVAFHNLLAEIRSIVWANALPEPRVYEILDTPFSTLKTPASTGFMFSISSPDAPPVRAAVCRESRAFVLRHYQPLTLSDTIKYMYIDTSRDIILLQPGGLHEERPAPSGIWDILWLQHWYLPPHTKRQSIEEQCENARKFSKLGTVLFVVHEEFKCIFSKPHTAAAESQLELPLVSSSFVKSQEDDQPRTAWHFRRNEIRYYPLHFEDELEEDEPDIEKSVSDGEDNDVELNRKPTNDDWRRFERRESCMFTLMRELREKSKQDHLPFLVEDASLLWRYEAS